MKPRETLQLADKIVNFVEDQGIDPRSNEALEAVLLAFQVMAGIDAAARIISDCAPKRSAY